MGHTTLASGSTACDMAKVSIPSYLTRGTAYCFSFFLATLGLSLGYKCFTISTINNKLTDNGDWKTECSMSATTRIDVLSLFLVMSSQCYTATGMWHSAVFAQIAKLAQIDCD